MTSNLEYRITRELTRGAKMVGTDFKIVGKRIGAGNFGEVRMGKCVRKTDSIGGLNNRNSSNDLLCPLAKQGERVAVKIERIVHAKGVSGTIRLRHEYEMLRELHNVANTPRGTPSKVQGNVHFPQM